MSAPGIGPGPTLWKSAILTTILRGRFPISSRICFHLLIIIYPLHSRNFKSLVININNLFSAAVDIYIDRFTVLERIKLPNFAIETDDGVTSNRIEAIKTIVSVGMLDIHARM